MGLNLTYDKPAQALLEKYEQLIEYFKRLERAAVAFSSGVDSTFLLYAAHEALGADVLAVTASSHFFPQRETEEAKAFCQQLGVKQQVVFINELEIEGFSQNPPNRCYICKHGLFEEMIKKAKEAGITNIVEGSNLDDNGDYRPGLMAVAELGILSPLREVGFTKEEIRILSAYFDLPTWDKPSFACLASRFPYGEEINQEKLAMVDKGEQLLLDMGFQQFRVRIHGKIARIELLPEEFAKLMEEDVRREVHDKFKSFGFQYVALDLQGYRTGSMNETLGGKSRFSKNTIKN